MIKITSARIIPGLSPKEGDIVRITTENGFSAFLNIRHFFIGLNSGIYKFELYEC